MAVPSHTWLVDEPLPRPASGTRLPRELQARFTTKVG